MPEIPKVKRAYNAKPVLESATFSPFSTFAFAGGEFLGEDPLQAYLTAKLELARAELGIFSSLSPAMQSAHRRLSQRLERTRQRYERLAGVLRTDPQASQVQKVISELGIAVPVGASQQELLRYVRWERDRLFREISRLEQRLHQIKTSVVGAEVPLADFLKDLEYFVEEFERSGYFQSNLPGLPTGVNESNRATIHLVSQQIERIAQLSDPVQQETALQDLYRFLRGEKDQFKAVDITLVRTRKEPRRIPVVPWHPHDFLSGRGLHDPVLQYIALSGRLGQPGVIRQLIEQRKRMLGEARSARARLREIKTRQAELMARLRELVQGVHAGFSPELRPLLDTINELEKTGIFTAEEARYYRALARQRLSIPLDDKSVLARAWYFAKKEAATKGRKVFTPLVEEYRQLYLERSGMEWRVGNLNDRSLFYIIRDLKAYERHLAAEMARRGLTDDESLFQYLVSQGLAQEAVDETKEITKTILVELGVGYDPETGIRGPNMSTIIAERARRLQRAMDEEKNLWDLRQEELEEQKLLDRVRVKRIRRPADTYERVVFSVDRFLASERPDTLRGVPDLESYVGRFLYARDSQGGRTPLEVIGIDRSGAEPSLIVRPVSLVHGREARLKVLTTPYSIIRYYETHLFPEAVARKWSVATKMDPYSREPAATSIFYEINERLERSRRHLEQVAREMIDDAKYRQTVVSFIRDQQVHVVARPWEQVLSELLGVRFSVSSRRLGMKTSFRIPYRMFLALERDFPFLMYGKDMDEVVESIVATAWTNLAENRWFQRQVERALSEIRRHPGREEELTQRLTEFIDKQIAKHLHQARGQVFSELLGDVAVEELGEAARYVAPLQYLMRTLEERGVPESQYERHITEILSRYRQDPSSVPKAMRPLVEGNDREIFEILRAMSSGRAKSPLSLNLPIDDEGELTLADIVADTVDDESVDWEDRIDTKLAIEEYAPAGRPQVQRAWIPPDLKGKHRNIFLRLMASYELSEEIESAGASLAERFLHIASGIMGRELSPEEQERLLAGGWQELIRMAKAENVPRPYVVPSLQTAGEYERLGLIRPGNLLLEHQGRLVAARITGPYEEGTAGLQLLIPSTGAEIVLSPTEQAGAQFLIPASQLSRYETAAVHPILGGNLAWAAGREVSLRPPVHPRLLAEMGYSVADVLKGAAVLRSGGIVGAVDIETTGLPEHYRLLGLDERFYPTEIGIAQFSIRGQDLKPIRSRRMIIRPSHAMEEWVRSMAALSEAEFISLYAKSGERAAVEAARQVYHQTLRGYAALVRGPGIRWATDVSEEEIRSLALQGLERAKRSGVYLSTAMKHYQAMVEDIAQRMGQAHIIAANAARAEAQWLARWMPEAPAPVVYHDPQAIFRLLYPSEQQYNLSHIARQLGIKVSAAQVHTSLYDARLAAKAYAQLVQDQRLETLINVLDERFFLRRGQILAQIQGGARNLYRVEDITPPTGGEQGRVVLRKLLGRPSWLEIAGASMGEIEQQLFGRFLPVAEEREQGIGVLLQEGELGIARAFATREEAKRLLSIEADYWADRARRDLLKAFNPASDLFQLFLLRPGSPEFAEALERLTPAYASGLAGRAPGKTGIGREVYQRTIREFLSSMEGALHRRFFTQVGQMIEAGIMDRQEAAILTKTYYNKLREMLEPQHRLPLRSSRFFLEVPGLGRRSVPLSSPEATRRQVERIIWQLAEAKAGLLPAREYFSLALRELRASLGELVPEEAGIDEIAQAMYREGRRLWQEGKLLMPDPTRGFLPEANRAEAIRRIWQLQNELLAERRQVLEILSSRPSAVFIGDLPAEDAFAIAEERAMPIRPPKSPEQFEALRRSVWRDITEAAFDPTRGRAHELASRFLGLGQGDLGQIRLPFPVSGEYGVPLGQVTLEQWPEVKRWLRRDSGLHMDMRSRIMEFWAQRIGERLRRRRQAGALAALAQSGRQAAPGARGWMWAGVAGAAALGLYAIGSVNMSRVQAPEPVPQTPPAQGLEIQIQATRTQPVDLGSTVQAATMAIQNALGLPLNVTVHQIDDTRTIDQRWAQEVVAQALRG